MKTEKEKNFYIKLRKKIIEWAESRGVKEKKLFKYILSAPDFFYLLWKLSTDKELPVEDRLLVGLAIFYFISPFDLFPEGVMGPIGYLDDIALSAYVVKKIIKRAGEEKVKKYWLGEEDLLLSIENILNTVDKYLGSGLWKRLVTFVESREATYKNSAKQSKKKTESSKEGETKSKKVTPKKKVNRKTNKAGAETKKPKRGRPKKSVNKKKEGSK